MIQDDSYIAESRCSQCIFDNNSADYGAGFMAIANNTSTINAAFSNCVFTRNNCIQSGGAVYFEARDNSFINPNYEYCTFYNNHNSFGLSGIINTRIATSNNNPVYINCIIRQTAITNVVAGSSTAATPTFINCNVEGSGGSIAWVASFGANGGGNIDTDPSFINASDFDGIDNIWATNDDGLSLQPASPCINAGNISLAAAMVDLVGNSRPIGSGVDMGAYEALLSTTYTITASAGVGGTISPIGITTLTTGSSLTYSISANAGYCINSVVVDGVNVGSISTYTFTGIAASHTIAVDFVARLTPTVSISIATNNVCFGSAAAIIASSINAGSTPLYNFYIDGIAQGAMAANIFNVSTLSVGLHRIYCVMAANNFCQTTNTVTSNTININVGNPTTLSPITGSTTLCTIGTTTRLYNSVIGGIWSSGNPSVATVNSIGVVTAVSNGTASIRYTYTNSFGCSSSVSIDFNVASIGNIDPIMGATNVCVGSSILLSNATPAGVWSSIAGRAIINPSGLVTGISSGIATIRYTVSNAFGCSGYTVRNIVVNSVPSIPRINYAVGTINPQIGASGGFCNGRTFTLVGNPSGGVWSTSNPAVISINSSTGETNTIGLGSAGITYTVTISGCSNSRTIAGNVVNCTSPKGVNLINENNQASNAEFTMFPNPTKRFTNLLVRNLNGDGQIIVADIRGKQVKTQILSLGINKIDVSNLSSGFYLVSVISNGSIQTKKLIIE